MAKRFNYKILFWVVALGLAILIICAVRQDLKSAKREAVWCASEGANRVAYLYLNQLDNSTRKIKGSLMVTDYPGEDETFELEYMTQKPNGQGADGDEILLQPRDTTHVGIT